ncbi:Plasma membrane proteolipid 3 [Smittium culicis]|uniref:Plasma membrane proteolipid 3 n=1 Tax=Smittium culicis TaxID=133412 RepID=A0A1R1X2H0_9FUNG|nr:Plasma membrane proteolipid 3 [Smittium culicis]
MSNCGSRFSSVVFPPLGVLMTRGINADLVINIALTALGYLPGLIHSCYVIDQASIEGYQRCASQNPCTNSPHTIYIINPAQPVSSVVEATRSDQVEPSFDKKVGISPPNYSAIN